MAVRTFTFVEGELIHQYDGTNSHDILPDPLCNVVGLLGANSGIEFDFEYWPYEEVPSAFSSVTPYRYIGAQGYYSDIYSRVYVVARHYRAPYGRWMTVDPLWPDEPAFGYASSSPMVNIDASGLRPCSKAEANRCFARLGRPCGAKDLRICTVITIKYVKCHIETSRDELFCECFAKRQWRCKGKCPIIGPTPPCGFMNRGAGAGATREAACLAARKDAASKPYPEECRPKHCECYDCERA